MNTENKSEITLEPELQKIWAEKDVLNFNFTTIKKEVQYINRKKVLAMLTKFGRKAFKKGILVGMVIGAAIEYIVMLAYFL